MEKRLSVSGMMCPNCEKHVQKAVMAISGVTEVKADHKSGIVSVQMESDVPEETLQKAIEDAGYTCTR